MNFFTSLKTLSAAALLLVSSRSVMAQNLVTNPGFETGTLAGWTGTWTSVPPFSGSVGYSGSYTFHGQVVSDPNAHSGSYNYFDAGVDPAGFLSQTIATVPGQQYTLSFWLKNTIGSQSPQALGFKASWNGTDVYTITEQPSFGWTQLTFGVTATSASTLLQFAMYNEPGGWRLDDVSVTAAAIPEPADFGLAFGGAALVAGLLSRRRKAGRLTAG